MHSKLLIKACLLIPAIWLITAHITAQPIKTAAGKEGIFIYCGNDLPKKFSYSIERKKAGDAGWQKIADIVFPKTADALMGNLLAAPSSVLLNQTPDTFAVKNIYSRAANASSLDSLYPYAYMPLYVSALGCGYFDKVAQPGTYSYQVSVIQGNRHVVVGTADVNYPGVPFNGKVEPLKMSVMDDAINFVFAIDDSSAFGGARVFRAKYGDTVYSEVPANVLFTGGENGRPQLDITDITVTPKRAYSYYIIPVDNLGNEGTKSEIVNVYNLAKPHDIGQVLTFKATAIDTAKSIKLSWALTNKNGLVSIDIYKGTKYNEPLNRVASVPASDSVYVDANISPTKTYYYSIVANGNFGKSNPSARVSAIIKGSNKNLFPPQHITATRKGNIVTLKFSKTESDTRAYYVFRGEGYTGKLVQLNRMLLSKDSALNFYDTLPTNNNTKIYTYAVADENTSYNISPLSERVPVVYGGVPPIPTRLNAKMFNDSVLLVWQKPTGSQWIKGYNVYRTATDENGGVKSRNELIATTQSPEINSYTDGELNDGWHYSYTVASVIDDEVSSMSSNASVTVPLSLPLNPANISVSSAEKTVKLSWDAPADKSVKTIKIYRAEVNGDFKMIAELPLSQNEYIDKSVAENTTYFYAMSATNIKNKESKKTDAVGIKIN